MRVLFDVDVLIDVLTEREPHVRQSAALLDLAESGGIDGIVAAHTLPTLFYLIRRLAGVPTAYAAVYRTTRILDVVPVDHDRIVQALALEWADFEDAIQAACALHAGVDAIATRNVRDYRELPLAVSTPAELMARQAG